MTADLKPCPFCGEMPKYYPDPGGGGPYIFCENDAGCYVRPSVWPKLAGRGVNIVSAWNRRAAPQWQPIETAPRDGSPIVAWFDNSPDSDGFAVIVRWDAPARHRDYPWIDENGRFAEANISHWMPLPAPPVAASPAQAPAVDDSTGADPVGKEG